MLVTAGPLAAAAAGLEPLPERQRLVALLLAGAVVVLVFELVRRRKLREEYSWVWIGTALGIAVLALYQDLLLTLSRWIGAASSVSTLFFGALLFLFLLVLQFSVRLSRLTHRQRTLGQRMALLEEELERLRQQRPRDAQPVPRPEDDRDEVA
ncbi:MAG: DUF2304 domain-containing protein [Planctomycetes bacterium]|nr:DUF2304 domain-containing protein [Planctomycetota bacterium]MCC7396033.1 DUF2304 domain-containing protein [Planctomycetota bacterium]